MLNIFYMTAMSSIPSSLSPLLLSADEESMLNEGLKYIGGDNLEYLSDELKSLCRLGAPKFSKAVALGVAAAGEYMHIPTYIHMPYTHTYVYPYTVESVYRNSNVRTA